MRTFIIFIALILSGCGFTYPSSYAKYMKTHSGDFEYDKVCKDDFCENGKSELINYKLAKLEQTESNVGEKYNKLLNNKYKKSELDMDCYNTMITLVKQQYQGCYDSVEKNEISLEEEGFHKKEVKIRTYMHPKKSQLDKYETITKSVRTVSSVNGKFISTTTVRPTERTCAIKLATQIQNVKSFCSTTYWKENEDTREFYKELAEDGMLASTYIRGSFSFDQKNPKKLVEGKCKVKSCENEFKLVNGEFGDSPAYAIDYDGYDQGGYDEMNYDRSRKPKLVTPVETTAEKIGLIMKVVEPLMFVIYPIKAFFTLVKDMSTQIIKDNL